MASKGRDEAEIMRVTRSKGEAQKAYDRISGWYDLLEGRWEEKARDAGLQKLHIKSGEKVLEIGPGTGQALMTLAYSAGVAGRAYGLDISPKMLQMIRQKIKDANLGDRTDLLLGDGARLPFKPQSFDAVFMSFTLELFDTPEIPKVLFECKKVLKDQGRICVISLSKTGGSRLTRRLYEWGHNKFPSFLDCRPIFVRQSLEEASFKSLDITSVSLWRLPIEIVLGIKS